MNKRNFDIKTQTNDNETQTKKPKLTIPSPPPPNGKELPTKWWQINIALWFLVGLFFVYFNWSGTSDLIRNTIIGGLIFSLIIFLGVEIPKSLYIFLTKLLNDKGDSLIESLKTDQEKLINDISTKLNELITDASQKEKNLTESLNKKQQDLIGEMSNKLEDVVIKARQERKAEQEKLIQSIAGGPIVQQLTNKMKKEGHEDLELYRFLGLKGEQEDSATFNHTRFQNFCMQEGNDNAVYFFWANTATTPPSQINAKVDQNNKSLIVSFETHTVGGANIAIRPIRDIARRRDNMMRYLCFDMRLIKEDESDSNDVEIGFRVVNGWLQHWEYSTKKGEGYKKVLLKKFGTESSDGKSKTFHTFNLDLEKTILWHLFESDGNYLYGLKPADFSIITSIIFEVGCSQQLAQQQSLAPKPGPGKGKFEVRDIRLSAEDEGHSI